MTLGETPAPADLQWRKNLALLIYLARSPKRTRTREHLIGLLWGDKPEATARHSLNSAVSVLRRYAGDDGIASDSARVSLHVGAVHLDVEDFETHVAAGHFAGAAELIKGEFLEGFSIPRASDFDDWLASEREHWRRHSVDALLCRAEELLAEGSLAPAHDLAEQAFQLDPDSAGALRTLMRALALAGDRVGALRHFEAFAARLRREMGTIPDAESLSLAERVRHERIWRLPKRVGGAVHLGAKPGRAPLVARAGELQRLMVAWTACCRNRRPAVAVIEGDMGMGKTRLAEEVVARARLDGAVAIAVRAVEADMHEAWSGVLALARGGLLDAPGAAAASPSAFGPLRSGTPGATPSRALSAVLQAVADEQPVLLFVDDVQWIDRESLLALGAAARDLPPSPLFILCTAAPRPARVELEELQARCGRELSGDSVWLGPLPTEAVQALATWALPAYDETQLDRVARRVAADSGGIPLLVVALLQAVAAGLDLQAVGHVWPEPFRTLDQALPSDLPDALVAAIRVLFGRLSSTAKRVLTAAAVLGGRTDAPLLGRAADVGDDVLGPALDELEWEGLLAADVRGYSFVARIVREVIDRDIVKAAERQRILAAAGGLA